ncbi:maleylpyruvate isomerase N-terminal domain-containing protein [Yimella sp. RIT 621]|uniref:maleylpyruvate isomerase N-terminal domain-containing protein n=1 Tax=Yimella sp. RIT 621 TaxID=2510323 RepID=UPI001459FD00
MSDIWNLVHAERHALVDDLSSLTDAQWQAPSLADGWTVHDVAAHLASGQGDGEGPGQLPPAERHRPARRQGGHAAGDSRATACGGRAHRHPARTAGEPVGRGDRPR